MPSRRAPYCSCARSVENTTLPPPPPRLHGSAAVRQRERTLTLSVVDLCLVCVDKEQDDAAYGSHGEQEPIGVVGVSSGAIDDGGGDKRSNKATSLANGVEECEEHVGLRCRHHLGDHCHVVRSPRGSLEVPRRREAKLPGFSTSVIC
jgi:hypothetical protein